MFSVMKQRKFLISILVISNTFLALAQEKSEWRGIGRTGVYNEDSLLKKWPENGPELLWFNDSVPPGFSSVAIANNTIYCTGIVGKSDVLVALDMNGKEIWRLPYGLSWDSSYPDSRYTPTVENNRIYLSSGKGEVVCIDAQKGKIIWSVNAMKEYTGVFGRWGIAESLLTDENNVFFTPGGEKTAMIALEKQTGKLVWKTESLNDNVAYTSPLMIERNGKKQIVNVLENYIFGVWPLEGKIAWKFDFGKFKKERGNNTNTPLYYDGFLYVTSGYDHAGVKLKLADDLSSVSMIWSDTILDSHFGGAVKIGDYIYGPTWVNNTKGNWACIDWNTGKLQYETEWKNKGSIIAADGMLYIYEEKSGYVALVKADPKEFKIISSFKIERGTGPYWSHPVIHNGILYIRHGNALIAYKIK